jgi:hypothetical protein
MEWDEVIISVAFREIMTRSRSSEFTKTQTDGLFYEEKMYFYFLLAKMLWTTQDYDALT